MSLDVYFREDIRNMLRGVALARGPMGDEAAQVLEAVAAGFGIQPETIGVERYVVTLEDIQRVDELRNRLPKLVAEGPTVTVGAQPGRMHHKECAR